LQLRIDTLPSAASRIKHSICILRDWSHSSLNSTMTSYPIILQVRNINRIFLSGLKQHFVLFLFDTQKTVTFDEQNKKSEHLKMLARGPIHFERIFLILRVLNWSAFWGTESTLNLRMILSKVTFIHRRGFFIFFSRFWSRIATQPKKDQLAHQSLSRRSWDPLLDYFENTRGFIRRVSVTLAWPVEGYSWITVRGTYTELFRCTYATGLILSSAYRDLYSLTFLWKLAN
jgi:hypothetical protein